MSPAAGTRIKTKLVLCNGWRGVHAHLQKALTKEGRRGPLVLRSTLLVVPTTAAGELLRAGLEIALLEAGRASVMPTLCSMQALLDELARRSLGRVRTPDPLLREALLEEAFNEAARSGAEPPFVLRSRLAPRVLAFYDRVHLKGHRFEDFTVRAIGEFDVPGDVGAERMAAATRFLAESLRRYREKMSALSLDDESTLRHALLERGPAFPYSRVFVIGPETIEPLDLSFLVSVSGLESLELVIPRSFAATSAVGGLEKTVELKKVSDHRSFGGPRLLSPSATQTAWSARDREEVLIEVARLLKAMARESDIPPLERIAVVVPSRLPYLYLAKKVFEQAGIPYQLRDDFPLATEPYVAAVDRILQFVRHDARRDVALGLLKSPFFRFPGVDSTVVADLERERVKRREPGGTQSWARMLARWKRRPLQRALPGMDYREREILGMPALEALLASGRRLSALAASQSTLTEKCNVLRAFLSRFGRPLPSVEEPARHERARGAVLSILERMSDAARRVGDPPVRFDEFREKLHRAIESHTFSLRTGGHGVQIVDSRTAGFGTFDLVFAVGLNEGEWPSRAERNIFYPHWILKDFGWPTDAEALASERAHFVELLRLPGADVAVFRHLLEDEIPTVPSPFLEEVAGVTEERRREVLRSLKTLLISRAEAFRTGNLQIDTHFRVDCAPGQVRIDASELEPVSATALELYLRCPFKYFARHVLGIEEEEDLDDGFTPMERGRVLHDILQTGFDRWDAHETGPRSITAENYDEALVLFRRIAEEKLPKQRRDVEMTLLFGGPGAPGAVEWLLRLEMKRGPLRRRLLEYAFDGRFRLDEPAEAESPWTLRVKGRADRVDIDLQGHLHLFDYKTGRAPAPTLTIQVPLYALCLSQELSTKTAEAAYVSLRDRKIVPRQDYTQALHRLRDTYQRISQGRFEPRPHQDHLCNTCGYVGICRKEIVEKKGAD